MAGMGTGDELLLTRAKFVYEAARLAAKAAGAPIVPESWSARDRKFQEQFLKIIEQETGPERIADAEKLHESWAKAYQDMGWQYGPERDVGAKTHPDLVPFDELDPLEQDKDYVFVALCKIARKWIRDDS